MGILLEDTTWLALRTPRVVRINSEDEEEINTRHASKEAGRVALILSRSFGIWITWKWAELG